MSRITCEICNSPSPNIYEPNSEGFYCATCYYKYESQILCDCDGNCPNCEGVENGR